MPAKPGTIEKDDLRHQLIKFKMEIELGTSGAPLITENGIVGMITEASLGNAEAVNIETIYRYVSEEGYPDAWDLLECGSKAPDPPPPEKPESTPKVKPIPKNLSNEQPPVKFTHTIAEPVERDNSSPEPPVVLRNLEESANDQPRPSQPTVPFFTPKTVNIDDIDSDVEGDLEADKIFATTRPSQPVVPVKPPIKTMTEEITGMQFVYIPNGCIQMGSSKYNDEGPVRKICVDGFWMGKYEVTQGQWKKIMGRAKSMGRKKMKVDDCPDCPENVSWDDAQDFLNKLNKKPGPGYRLPTEAEWEYAARAGTTTVRYWGDDISCDRAMYGNSDHWPECFDFIRAKSLGMKSTVLVGSYDANPFGLYDMFGNVWEWCSDWYGKDYYSFRKEKNPQGPPSGTERVIRGGSWFNRSINVRASKRDKKKSKVRSSQVGFRLVLPVQ